MMGVLVEGVTPSDVATASNLKGWVNSLSVPFTYTLDSVAPQTDLETFFSQQRDSFIIIDLRTMKIVEIDDNFNGGGGVTQALASLEQLLQ